MLAPIIYRWALFIAVLTCCAPRLHYVYKKGTLIGRWYIYLFEDVKTIINQLSIDFLVFPQYSTLLRTFSTLIDNSSKLFTNHNPSSFPGNNYFILINRVIDSKRDRAFKSGSSNSTLQTRKRDIFLFFLRQLVFI